MGNKFFMNRRKSREQAFIFLFESSFELQSVEEIIKEAGDIREDKLDDFSKSLVDGVLSNTEKIDKYLVNNLNGWQKERLSRTTLTLLRLCIYEILYCEEIPESVSINEAVELAKKYGSPEEASYINGVLGSVVKQLGSCKKGDK